MGLCRNVQDDLSHFAGLNGKGKIMHDAIKPGEERRERAGIARSKVLARAGISSAAFARWKDGHPPKPANVKRFEDALDALIREGQAQLAAAS
jgi:hypothetical protein